MNLKVELWLVRHGQFGLTRRDHTRWKGWICWCHHFNFQPLLGKIPVFLRHDDRAVVRIHKPVENQAQLVRGKGCRAKEDQKNKKQLFSGVWKKEEFIDLVITNPPFHASRKEAEKAQLRKLRNLIRRQLSKHGHVLL